MKKYLLKVLLISVIALPFISCDSDDDDEPWIEPVITTTGVYFLNSGTMGKNDGSLSYYNVDTKSVTENVFYNTNNKQKLGDVAQDMVVYGSKMYITVTNTNTILVTDHKAKLVEGGIISPMSDDSKPLNPRSILAYNGKIYVSTEGGYVLRIDTTTLSIEKKVKAGTFLEEMAVSNNTLFVANSNRGASKSLSAINISSFSESKDVDLGKYNPMYIAKDKNGNIYALCWGDWNVPENSGSSLIKIDPKTNKATQIGEKNIATYMAMANDKLILVGYGEESEAVFSYYDINTNKVENKSFVTDGTTVPDPQSITVDPTNGNIYVSSNPYGSSGSMYIFSSEGKLLDKKGTGGEYPIGAYFLTALK